MKEDLFFLGIKALIRDEAGKILLLQVNPAFLIPNASWSGNAYWDIPGGRIKRGDSIEVTLQREVEEEIGVSKISNQIHVATIISPQRVPVGDANYGLMLSVYTCNIPPKSRVTLSKENLDFGWFEPTEAAKLLSEKYPLEFTSLLIDLK